MHARSKHARLHARWAWAACLAGAGLVLGLPAAAGESPGESPVEAPVVVDGLWCGAGPLRDFSLRLKQQQQDVEGELVRRGRARTIEGRLEGNVLRTQSTKVGALVLEKQGEELKVTDGDGAVALLRGQSFRRTSAEACSG